MLVFVDCQLGEYLEEERSEGFVEDDSLTPLMQVGIRETHHSTPYGCCKIHRAAFRYIVFGTHTGVGVVQYVATSGLQCANKGEAQKFQVAATARGGLSELDSVIVRSLNKFWSWKMETALPELDRVNSPLGRTLHARNAAHVNPVASLKLPR
jgi:hypothetical protein